jgi:hypothetical protein
LGTGDSDALEYIPIVSVQIGDYAFSLNEATERIEPHRIKGLLDMGVKPVYKLTTASGRSIKTTANHPYLVSGLAGERVSGLTRKLANPQIGKHTNQRWTKVSELKVGDEVAVAEEGRLSSWVEQYNSEVNYNNSKHYDIQKDIVIKHGSSPFVSSNCPEINNQSKYPSRDIKMKKSHDLFPAILANFADTIINAKVMAMPATNVNQGILPEVEGINTPTTKEPNIILAPSRKKSDMTSNSSFINIRSNHIIQEDFVKPFVNSDILWDKIVSIEPVGYEHVYDIEVEGTHNFIGNGIFAHNTYLESNQLPVTSEQRYKKAAGRGKASAGGAGANAAASETNAASETKEATGTGLRARTKSEGGLEPESSPEDLLIITDNIPLAKEEITYALGTGFAERFQYHLIKENSLGELQEARKAAQAAGRVLVFITNPDIKAAVFANLAGIDFVDMSNEAALATLAESLGEGV